MSIGSNNFLSLKNILFLSAAFTSTKSAIILKTLNENNKSLFNYILGEAIINEVMAISLFNSNIVHLN